ncbi:glutathione S-transferase family protein [Rosenbergiella epipactidis]|uniref:glutathione S-transferase family protein n=1 Tax=Rosenbergiella epipactidis TaxID=1544694 RepID=UPI001F4E2388|nr:glutathione S-transferase [Rosenbergiella epipactidis]
MKIYRFPKSRSLKVLWTLEELGINYSSISVDLLAENSLTRSPHPFGKVPYLVDGDISISETLAICIYLCEKNEGKLLYPTNIETKASVNTWLSFAATELESNIWGLLKQLVFVPEEKRNADLVLYFTSEANKAISQLSIDENLQWIACNEFTLADIFISQMLQWAKACGITLPSPADAYLDKTLKRASYYRAVEKNDAP